MAAGLVVLAGPAVAQDADGPDDGLDEVGTTTWRVEPSNGRATATIALTLRNTVPDTADARTFFDGYGIALPMPPTDVVVRSDGADLQADVDRLDDGTSVLSWDFPARLFHDETQDFDVEVAWQSAPPRTDVGDGPRITDAFVMVPVWAWGRDGAELEVRVPDRLSPRLGRNDPDTVDDGVAVFRRDDAEDFSELLVGASDDGDHATQRLDVEDTTVIVEAWPDDRVWGTRVGEFAARALPRLAAWMRTAWVDDTLTIRETARPVAEGWGGWNDPAANTISVGEEFDRALWTHELAHNWFDEEQFADTWLLEGLTEEATESLAEELEVSSPPIPAPTDQVLLDWWDILGRADRELVDDPEAWYALTDDLYAGAHHVVDVVADEVGEDTFREIVRMTLQDESAWGDLGYAPDPAADWREFLDLSERVGGSTAARQVILTHVRPGSEEVLARRDRAIADVDELADHPWGLPTTVAASMHAWRFEVARVQAAAALDARQDADALTDRAEAGGWSVPDLRRPWRDGQVEVVAARVDALDALIDDLEALATEAERAGLPRPTLASDLEDETTTEQVGALRRLVDDLVEAEESLAAVQDDPVASVGLVGVDTEAVRDRMRTAFAEAEPDAARLAVVDLEQVVDTATQRGRVRIGAATTAVLVMVALVAGVAWVRRRRRPTTASA